MSRASVTGGFVVTGSDVRGCFALALYYCISDMDFSGIEPVKDGLMNAVIETPAASRNKYAFVPEHNVFKLKKTLPLGMSFPFDFGFVPGTTGGDGDPLDVLIIMEEHGYPGCLVACRILGVLEAEQREKGKKITRNDRIIAVPDASILYRNIKKVSDLNKQMVQQVEHFFVDYNRHEGKEFIPLRWAGSRSALKLIREATVRKS